MPVPRLKICGMTNLADARYCAGVGADYLGFIQHPDSPRYVEPEFAKEIIEWLYGPSMVGVFVNADAQQVNRICLEAGFDVAQLHGEEPPEMCANVAVPVIKAIRVSEDATAESISEQLAAYDEHVDAFLLDTLREEAHGGTGHTFDWSVAKPHTRNHRIMLAGGLSAENVCEAVESIDPWGVDVSSSLESEPGQKDFSLIDAFMDVYRQLAEGQSSQ